MKQYETLRQAEEKVLRLIRAALGPLASVEIALPGSGADLNVRLAGGDVISIEFRNLDGPGVPGVRADAVMYLLRRAPRRLHDEFRRAGRSFVDTSGTVHLALPNILVDRTNLRVPAARGAVRHSFDPFSDRASLIARTLMDDIPQERTWGVRELAGEAGVSPATATRVVRELERHGVQVRRSGRSATVRLVDAHTLFSAWTRAYDWTRNPSAAFNAPIGDATRFLRRMRAGWSGPRWALTLHAGAARVAPLATWNRVHVYVDVPESSALVGVGEAQGWVPSEGGNVVLLKPWYRTSVWHGMREISGLPVVSPLQLALDLWHYPLRGREQAEHLLDTLLPGKSRG